MDLILWRHAEAIEAAAGEDDLSRRLTPKGERQAQRMAEWLNQRLTESTRILVSPAHRCQQTAAALGRRVKTLPQLGPMADVDSLLEAAGWPDATAPALLVGHQPGLGKTAGWLLTGQPICLAVKKGAVWWFRNRDREGLAAVVLQAVQAPDCL
jgi:phosphohistidine phosphatase